jgi:exonuclease III
MTIISVYAPTEDENKRKAEYVEWFYNKLSDMCDKTARNDALILLGDLMQKLTENTQIKQ